MNIINLYVRNCRIIGLKHSLNENHRNKLIWSKKLLIEDLIKKSQKIDRKNYIGFVRLSTIDLTDKSNQPIVSENKKISLIYTGEIYNYLDLKNIF